MFEHKQKRVRWPFYFKDLWQSQTSLKNMMWINPRRISNLDNKPDTWHSVQILGTLLHDEESLKSVALVNNSMSAEGCALQVYYWQEWNAFSPVTCQSMKTKSWICHPGLNIKEKTITFTIIWLWNVFYELFKMLLLL